MFIRLIFVAALACMTAPASAQNSDNPFLLGNWFVRNCDTPTWKLGCVGYILGYFHGSQTREKTVCLPDGVDTGQLIEVALAYMRTRPEKGHIVGLALIDEAWIAAFPCRNSN